MRRAAAQRRLNRAAKGLVSLQRVLCVSGDRSRLSVRLVSQTAESPRRHLLVCVCAALQARASADGVPRSVRNRLVYAARVCVCFAV